jgi:hypothetical protein
VTGAVYNYALPEFTASDEFDDVNVIQQGNTWTFDFANTLAVEGQYETIDVGVVNGAQGLSDTLVGSLDFS